MRNTGSFIWHIPRRICCALISVYQATLSPDHGPLKGLYTYGYCRHEPTCSKYSQQVLTDRGVVIGSLMTLKRLCSCHPWKPLSPEKIMKITSQ
ncbi:MAG: membrane protein insertion efficiency factor YidD [Candidatus Peribacter sp.]|nr:membrane protein insertion efficiency factor YidD [Candidatus Peribacter sp.]MBT4392683.1 membrane protein insertion efficiency factor YidD [Candidatus Peribacter sp.]MBT4600700.1 membrane protein insertion efficiency factor YidD [Candidatus Peribacter sp.]MBT5148631.1 membrane protein insertion efficiency factor YidD [Candidatus Peribacter sp.]MBT5637774.1 membrane protein insertion efficiency factor YidD [Candidatus Peribacter sp.]